MLLWIVNKRKIKCNKNYRVRAKSNGYTKHKEVAPAAPPDAKLPMK